MCRIICAVPISLRALRVISAPSAFLLSSLNPVNPVNPVKNQPVPPPPLAHRVSDTMAVRQNTVRKASGVFVPGRSIVEVCKCESVQVWKSTKSSISVQSHWILVLTAGY